MTKTPDWKRAKDARKRKKLSRKLKTIIDQLKSDVGDNDTDEFFDGLVRKSNQEMIVDILTMRKQRVEALNTTIEFLQSGSKEANDLAVKIAVDLMRRELRIDQSVNSDTIKNFAVAIDAALLRKSRGLDS